ncbi:MAG: VOC family protein [Hyphomicrobiaceae bacterium]|nr:VOC family protein [Hyphomicrobiaceae bacterium]
MTKCRLDHLVVAAATLEQGVEYLEKKLGVAVPEGGAHPLMGTHNHLMQLGGDAFLEVIAVDPGAPSPTRPRWYALDDPAIQARIEKQPSLITWVVRTDDIVGATRSAEISPGPVIEGRRGDMVWQITVPDDGAMPDGGLFPTLIQWPGALNAHGPAPNMVDLGCRLDQLIVFHPQPTQMRAALESIGAADLADVAEGSPHVEAVINCPKGAVTLD